MCNHKACMQLNVLSHCDHIMMKMNWVYSSCPWVLFGCTTPNGWSPPVATVLLFLAMMSQENFQTFEPSIDKSNKGN